MPNQTPRKRMHARNASASQRIAGVSDYESDAPLQSANPPPLNPSLLSRTNTDLNLSVLRRYIPSIHSIVGVAANAVVYTFEPTTSSWERTGTEGTYFLCFLAPAPQPALFNERGEPVLLPPPPPRACIIILNRRGLENTILDLALVDNFEVMDEIYIFKMADGGALGTHVAEAANSVVGVWIHAEDQETRMANAAMVQETIRLVQAGGQHVADEEEGARTPVLARTAEAPQVLQAEQGRKVSVSELFGGYR